MAFQSRTWVATLSFTTLLTAAIGACGYLPLQAIPLADDDGGGVGVGDPRSVADGSGGTDPDASLIDAGCTGPSCPGTYVSATTGNDANPGTGAAPVKTIMRGIEIAIIASKLGGSAENVYVAAAEYKEKITLAEGVSLLGGYACDATACPWTRDVPPFDKLETAITDTDFEGVYAGNSITRATLLEGFGIQGKTVTTPSGTAAVTIDEGTPTIRHCRIVAGGATVASLSKGISIGVAIFAPSNDPRGPLLDQNRIDSGDAVDESFGVLIDSKANPPNTKPAVAVLTDNVIRGGSAPFTSGVAARASGPGTLLRGNDIAAGSSNRFGAWGISVATEMAIDANRINLDQSKVGNCLQMPQGSPEFCGGIQSVGSPAVITNNVVLGMKGEKSCAVLLAQELPSTVVRVVILNANTLDGAGELGASGISAALVLRRIDGAGVSPPNIQIANVRNNILIGGVGEYRFGVYEADTTPGRTVHPAALDHNDFWQRPGGTPAAYRYVDPAGPKSLPFAQLPTFPPTPNFNLAVDPMLDGNFAIAKTSLVVGKGTSKEAPPNDITGKPRPPGAIDLGAFQAK